MDSIVIRYQHAVPFDPTSPVYAWTESQPFREEPWAYRRDSAEEAVGVLILELSCYAAFGSCTLDVDSTDDGSVPSWVFDAEAMQREPD